MLDIHVYWNILTMHGHINVKSPNNTNKWQMGFNSAFKGLNTCSPTVFIMPVSEDEVEKVIKVLKGKHSAGVDEVSVVLKRNV